MNAATTTETPVSPPPRTLPAGPYCDAKEVGAYLGVSARSVYRISSRELPWHKRGVRGRRYHVDDVKAYDARSRVVVIELRKGVA